MLDAAARQVARKLCTLYLHGLHLHVMPRNASTRGFVPAALNTAHTKASQTQGRALELPTEVMKRNASIAFPLLRVSSRM